MTHRRNRREFMGLTGAGVVGETGCVGVEQHERYARSVRQYLQLRSRIGFGHALGGAENVPRHPLRKRCFVQHMLALCRVHLVQAREALARKAIREPDQRRPQTLVHVSDLAIDNAADEDLRRIARGTCDRKDFLAARMRPPIAPDCFADDRLGERRNRAPARGLGNHAVTFDEIERLRGVQDFGFLRRSCCHNTSPWPLARASTRASTNSRSERRFR